MVTIVKVDNIPGDNRRFTTEAPITRVRWGDTKIEPAPSIFGDEIGSFVSIRPCADEYDDKTFLGIYIGEWPTSPGFLVTRDDHDVVEITIGIAHGSNPVIYVPSLKRTFRGSESWWSKIKSPDDFKHISDADIESVWYVRALKSLAEDNNI